MFYLSPTPLPGERGYLIIKHELTPFSPGRRGQGDEVICAGSYIPALSSDLQVQFRDHRILLNAYRKSGAD